LGSERQQVPTRCVSPALPATNDCQLAHVRPASPLVVFPHSIAGHRFIKQLLHHLRTP
jgi:hypothetical protein